MQFLSAMDPGLDGRVVAIVALITAATVVEVGLVPALNASRRDPLTLIRGSSGGRIAGRRDRVGPMLVCAQVAVSLILVSNAAVLVGTFERQARRDLGFDASHLVVADVRWRAGGHPAGDWTSLVGEMTVRAAALPGASRAAVASGAPLVPGGAYQEVVVPGYPYAEGEPRKLSVQFVGPGYFGTIGAALLSGREFAATDRSPESAVGHGFDVVVVNEAFAKRYWPGSDPVGKQVAYHNRGAATVVGVVRDLNDVTVSAVVPRAYFPLFEFPVMSRVDLIVRSRGDPALTQGAVRSVVLSSALPVDPLTVQTMGDVVDDALMISRVGGIGLTACAAVALLLTAIGLYGLVASWSAERRTEIGIRLALGAQVRHVHAVLLGGVGRLVAIGGVVGIGGAVALMRLERAWWGPAIALEPVAVLTGVALFTLVAGIAAFVPSWRATAIAPADVLNAG
jgi:predicted permease